MGSNYTKKACVMKVVQGTWSRRGIFMDAVPEKIYPRHCKTSMVGLSRRIFGALHCNAFSQGVV